MTKIGISGIFILILFRAFVFADDEPISTAADRMDIHITIYNSKVALVTESRTVQIDTGELTVQFRDMPAAIIPQSLRIRDLSDGKIFTVIEQNYDHDLVSPEKLIEKYAGRKVRLEYINPQTGFVESVDATVISNGGEPVFRIGNELTFDYPGRIFFPDPPEDLVTTPTVSVLLNSFSSGGEKVQLSYLVRDVGWQADYNLVIEKDEKTTDLSGWVTIDNRSGTVFRDAKVRLVAGQPNLVEEMKKRLTTLGSAKQVSPVHKSERVFEYHVYNIVRRTDIRNNHKKQILLADIKGIPVKKLYIVKGDPEYYYGQYRKGITRENADVILEMVNSADSNLGFPIPAGIVRMYRKGDSNEFLFIGEDRLSHVPADEVFRVKTGKAFDITTERKQTDWIRIAEGVFESTLEIKIRNHKKDDIVVTVVEPIPGDWRILETTCDFRNISAHEAAFDVTVPSEKESMLRYRVRVIL